MKKLIFLMLTFAPLILFGQSSERHCLNLDDSRFLHERALKSVYLDSAVNALEGKIIVLEESSARQYNDFQSLLNVQKDKDKVHSEILKHTESLVQSYKDENGALRKQVKREKRKTKAVGLIGIVVIVLALI